MTLPRSGSGGGLLPEAVGEEDDGEGGEDEGTAGEAARPGHPAAAIPREEAVEEGGGGDAEGGGQRLAEQEHAPRLPKVPRLDPVEEGDLQRRRKEDQSSHHGG